MDLEQFDKQCEEVRRVLAQLPPEARTTHALVSPSGSHLSVFLPLDDSAHGIVAKLCGLFGTPTVERDVLVFPAAPTVRVEATGRVRRFTSIPTSAQFVMPEDAA